LLFLAISYPTGFEIQKRLLTPKSEKMRGHFAHLLYRFTTDKAGLLLGLR